MKKTQEFFKKNYLVIVSFLATFFLYTILILINKDLYPFGNETILYSDMSEQYISFFNYLRNTIFTNNGLFNSFSFSLGNNFYGILTYFCISPLNILLVFSNNATMPIFMTILIILKMSLASATMAILLKNKFKSSNFIILFAMLYGLMSYNLVYSMNVIWMDCVYLLPLIILGLERLIEKSNPKMYLFTLTLSIFCNYYISFSICIFLIIYYIYYVLAKNLKKEEIKKTLIMFIKYSLLAVLISAVILIPTIFNMIDGKLAIAPSNLSLKPNYNVSVMGYRFMIGDHKLLIEDLPFITSSLMTLLLVVIYIFNKKITKRDKIVTISTLIFLVAITLFPLTDTIMHCFRVPNMFPYRYAFVISFFMIITAYKNFDLRDSINKKSILMYILIGGLVFYFLKLYIGFKTVLSSILLLIYFCLIIFVKNKKILFMIIIPFFMLELVINTTTSLNELPRNDYDDYYSTYQYENQIDEIKPAQNEFYRLEGKNRVTFNDAFALSFYGVRSFSPTITLNSNKLLKDYLSLPLNNSYAIDYVSTTAFIDSFLGLKYTYYITDTSYYLEENEAVLPVFFSIDKNSKFIVGETSIENQNNLYKYLSRNNDELFTEIKDIVTNNCTLETDEQGIYLKSEQATYCFFELNKKDDDHEYYIEIIEATSNIAPNYPVAGITTQYGDKVILDLKQKASVYVFEQKTYINSFKGYVMDKNKLKSLSETLDNQKMHITSHNNDKVTGTINNKENNRIMFTTIPYDDGWHVKINGSSVKTFKNIDSLLAFELPIGELDIEISFIPKGFISGLTISIFTLDIVLYILYRRKKYDK